MKTASREKIFYSGKRLSISLGISERHLARKLSDEWEDIEPVIFPFLRRGGGKYFFLQKHVDEMKKRLREERCAR